MSCHRASREDCSVVKTMDQTQKDSPVSSISPVVYAAAGALLGGAAAAFAFRGRSFHRAEQLATDKAVRQVMEAMNSSIHGLRQEVQQSVSSAESRLGSKLQTQERAIAQGMSSHYKDLGSRLDTVNAARTELSGMSRKMEDLQTIFLSPKRRGTFGELQLEALIADVMHPGSFQFQASLPNGKRPDCLLRLSQPIGNLAIDSKFPMDSFLELSTATDASTKALARKKLSDHLRKHVKDIADKYIIPGETADCAILFLPSEAIFAELVEHHAAIVTEAHQARVWIASPTTLMAVLTTMRGVVRGMAVSERADAIVSEVGAIVQDLDRLIARAEKVERNIETARENFRLLRISMDKVQRRKQKLDLLHDTDEEVPSLASLATLPSRVNGEAKVHDRQEQSELKKQSASEG